MELVLALGGGGAKGHAHLGVLRCLEEAGIKVAAIAGTSAGGIIGACYAAGYTPDELVDYFQQLDQGTLYGRRPEDGPSLLGVAGLNQMFEELLGERTFDDLQVPLTLTAVDINSGCEVLLREGRVVDAVLASMAIPGIFPPKAWNGALLVDGGVVDPVPVGPARQMTPGMPVIAVSLTAPPENARDLPAMIPSSDIPVFEYVARTRVAQAFNIFVQSINISTASLAELRLQLDRPDVLLRPDVLDIGVLDYVNVAELARRGEAEARAHLPEIRRAAGWAGALRRKVRVAWHAQEARLE
ncbi:MAG: patatin-like phospholipase family protein [Anaerolineales bacterium]